MKNRYHYVGAFNTDGSLRYVTGFGASDSVLWTPGFLALPMSAHTADRVVESLQEDGQNAFVIKGPKSLPLQNPQEKKFELRIWIGTGADGYIAYETSCGQAIHAIDAFRKDCDRIGLILDNASFGTIELRDADGNVIDELEE